jgi:cell division protein FtsB
MILVVMERPTRTGSSLGRAGIVLAVIAGVLILGDLNQRLADARRLERDTLALQTEVAGMEAQAARLATQVAQATSESLVEEWARREGKMVREGEHLIVPIPPAGTSAAPAFAPTPIPPAPSNWEIWWALLTGG